ncbi:hypothetical protein L6278_00730, partial [Candidatus Parcubacteria bacterium]|nr:hypothetical protein [Candidatus Parcubacteria bacterium]
MIIGNDWLCHIIVGAFLVWKFGWWGVPLAFLSHFPIDAIPHGHHKKEWLDALKGLVAGVSIVISVWSFYGFTEAFKYGIGIFFSINFDFLLAFLAKPWDEKKFWENKTKILSRTIFIFTKIIIWINFI